LKTSFIGLAISLLMPAAANASIGAVLNPAMSGVLARSSNPTAAIAGYGLALSIMLFVGLPQLRTQQLTLVYAESSDSIKTVGKFLLLVIATVILFSFIVITPSVKDFLLSDIFGVSGILKTHASQSLTWLLPLPCLLIIRMYLYGIALKFCNPAIVWAGTIFGATSVLAIAIYLLMFTGFDGAVTGAIAMSFGTTSEVLLMFLLTKLFGRTLPNPSISKHIHIKDLVRFFLPMVFAAFLPSATLPIINAGLARTNDPITSIAAVSMASGLFALLTIPTNGIQNTSLTLMARGKNLVQIKTFSIGVGLITMIIAWIFILISPIHNFIISNIMGITEELMEETMYGLTILAILPLALVFEQFYSAHLMHKKNTIPLIYINLWRLGFLTVWIIGTVNLTQLPGITIGAGAWLLTLSSEAFFTWIYAKKES